MPGTIILALDPGQIIGFSFLELTGRDTLEIKSCGLIVPNGPTVEDLLRKVRGWIQAKGALADELAWEGPLNAYNMPTNHESHECRAVLRQWAMDSGKPYQEYNPATVSSCATVLLPEGQRRGKKAVRQGVRLIMGGRLDHIPLYLDHVPDAVAVGIAHATKAHAWRPIGYEPKRKVRGMDPLLSRLHAKMEALR